MSSKWWIFIVREPYLWMYLYMQSWIIPQEMTTGTRKFHEILILWNNDRPDLKAFHAM